MRYSDIEVGMFIRRTAPVSAGALIREGIVIGGKYKVVKKASGGVVYIQGAISPVATVADRYEKAVICNLNTNTSVI